jgi:hypothetical protein
MAGTPHAAAATPRKRTAIAAKYRAMQRLELSMTLILV